MIVSIDVDVGSEKIGILNRGRNDRNVNLTLSERYIGKIEEMSLPLFINFFDNLSIPITIAIRGQLVEVNSNILGFLCKSKHDIGAHGYYHKNFKNLSYEEVENELYMIREGMKIFSINPKSFIFPQNGVKYLNLLQKYGYVCYRGEGGNINDGMYINKKGNLYDIHPSLFLGELKKIDKYLIKIVDIAIENRLPLHLWFHAWNYGNTKDEIINILSNLFYPLFKYAKEKEDNNILRFETMLSATKYFNNDTIYI